MLTDLEAAFRSLKSELGFRPVYHHKEERVDGHLFITVLAYQYFGQFCFDKKIVWKPPAWEDVVNDDNSTARQKPSCT
jgi:hypothetical protein